MQNWKDEIEFTEANIRYYKEQLAIQENRLFEARVASGEWVMNRHGKLVRVKASA